VSNNRSENGLAAELATMAARTPAHIAGIIRARHVSADYRTLMDPDDVEAALSAMSNLSTGHKR